MISTRAPPMPLNPGGASTTVPAALKEGSGVTLWYSESVAPRNMARMLTPPSFPVRKESLTHGRCDSGPIIRLMRWRNLLAAGGTVVAIVAVLRAMSVDSAGIAAPLLLLDVVVVARFWGMTSALIAAAMAAASYSYYFLPPEGFAIPDPVDWVEFVTFIVTAVVAGELASRAERRAAEAQGGRPENERLYQELQIAFDNAREAEGARRNEQPKSARLDGPP